MAFIDQRGEGESLGGRPIDALAGFDRLAAIVEEALDRLVDVEAFRNRAQLFAIFAQLLHVDAGLAAPGFFLPRRWDGLEARPAAVEPVGLVGLVGLARLIFGVEAAAPVGLQLVDFALGEQALADQLFANRGRASTGAPRIFLYIKRLGEGRLVALVVAEAAVAPHVDDDGLLEFLAEFRRDLGAEHHGFRIVAVAVEDRRLDRLGDVGRIGRGARIARIGGEADLVVDDEMDRAAGAMALEAGQAETFRDHALTGESRVAMDQQRHDAAPIVGRAVGDLVLLGAHLAEHDRIDDFEMRGIGGQRQMDLVVVEFAVGRGAEVIFHVAGAFDRPPAGRSRP